MLSVEVTVRYQWITFTTDYGLADSFVGVCHGVMGRIAPHARVIDVTHGVPAGNVRHGAHALAQAVGYLPPSVHLAVVDPGVGTVRRGIVIVARDGLLVGPDNGLLTPAAAALGGAEAAYELTSAEHRLLRVSATFHGRDVFAPAAAHLANGVIPEELGTALPLTVLDRLPAPAPTVRSGAITCEVLTIDRFGNVQLSAPDTALGDAGLADGDAVIVRVGAMRHAAIVGTTFADAAGGDLVVLGDSSWRVTLAINGGSAATRLGLTPGHEVLECTIEAALPG